MNKRIEINKYIVADPEICHGKPTFKGTRIMVWQILQMLAQGENEKSIRQAFPRLNSSHIKAALEYASSITQENYVVINTYSQVSH